MPVRAARAVIEADPDGEHRAVIERARMIVVEESRGRPDACGVDNGIRISEIDYIIDGDHAPAPELLNPPASGSGYRG